MSPALDGPLHYASIAALASAIRAGELSPVSLTGRLLERIEELDGGLHSYATVMADTAMACAQRAQQEIDAGAYRGPLHGIPIAVKDLCYTRGVRTMGGLAVCRDFVPDFDATVVTRLEQAGAVMLGKLNLTEGALSAYNPAFEIPVNPWGSKLWAGVSSSGSGVAVAAGLCCGALGTDTGGSIRYPAMANGIVGLKPTYGRVSRHGVMELAGSLDHVGPMTRTVRDAAIMLAAIAGPDPADATTLATPLPDILDSLDGNIAGLRIGVDRDYLERGTDAGLVTALDQVLDILAELGAVSVPVNMPKMGPLELRELWLPICGFEAARAHAGTFPARADEYGGYLRGVLELGAAMSEADYRQAQARRRRFSENFQAELDLVDAVICPSGGFVFEVDRQSQYGDAEAMAPVIRQFQGQFTIPADLAGTPTLSLPCGLSADARPYVVQFLGSHGDEQTLCRIGHAFEQANPRGFEYPALTASKQD